MAREPYRRRHVAVEPPQPGDGRLPHQLPMHAVLRWDAIARQEAAQILDAVGEDDRLLLKVMTARRIRLLLAALLEPVEAR